MLNDRKLRVLRAITEDYISTAQPVGSRTIARKHKLGVSPATIRNEMADLEDSGYLRQPHTSAGRIPSDKGYRLYVDCLMDPENLTPEQRREIRDKIMARARVVQEIVHETSKLLSLLTQYTAVVLAPQLSHGTFRHIQLVPMNENNVLVVLVVDPGFVHNKIVEVSEPVSAAELERLGNFLNSKLRGLTLEEVGSSLLAEIREEVNDDWLFAGAMDFLRSALDQDSEERVYLDGTVHIFNQPEFHDVERARLLLEVLEDNESLCDVLASLANKSGITISIGHENRLQDLRECSLVTATYEINGHVVGTVGVLGPTRMEYSKSFAAVEYIAALLSELLSTMDRR